MSPVALVSVIVPVYLGEPTLRELYTRVRDVLTGAGYDFELLLVDDCGPDQSWAVIRDLAKGDERVKGIRFSRNFGQHYALSAGIDQAKGDWCVTMDCDLQDRPEDILLLINKAKEGFDVVYGVAPFRAQPTMLHKLYSNLFYKVYDFLAENKNRSLNPSFILLSKTAAQSFRRYTEKRRIFLNLIQHMGFESAKVTVEHLERPVGKSSYTFKKRWDLAINGMIAGTTRLLRFGIGLGLFFSVMSLALGAFFAIGALQGRPFPLGWASTIVSIFFVGGTILVFLGIMGLYLEVIFHEIKSKPHYMVREALNIDER